MARSTTRSNAATCTQLRTRGWRRYLLTSRSAIGANATCADDCRTSVKPRGSRPGAIVPQILRRAFAFTERNGA